MSAGLSLCQLQKHPCMASKDSLIEYHVVGIRICPRGTSKSDAMPCRRLLKGLLPELSKAMAEVEKKEQVMSYHLVWATCIHVALYQLLTSRYCITLRSCVRSGTGLINDRAHVMPVQALLDPSDRKAEDQRRREAALRHIQDDYEARKLVQERQRLALQAAEDAANAKAAAEAAQAAQRAAAQHEEEEEDEEEKEMRKKS